MSTVKLYPPKPEKVYFFGTCLIDVFYPGAGLDAVSLLERENIEVLFPDGQTCCGQPAFTSGYRAQAIDVARHQLRLFDEPWPIIVPSGSCGGMMRRHYPELFDGQPEEQAAKSVAERIFELTEFLVHVCHVRLKDHGPDERVAMHTSCSARREMGLADTGPALLRQLSNVTLVEQARASECCGFGGTFSVKHGKVSQAMVEDKCAAIEAAQAEHLVTSDCGCLMNIDGHFKYRKAKVHGEHIASYLWRRSS
ncbi:(Fe-S)-binding protein [Larsenimonas suaedae]|uniref:(Fe-S)-binding protein n=1 Tax=Larsenimonas suaedae TaxID=1851019 RepID=A0ABU1GR01_9GAMM|nr:(Fe-S)-binding protein [Larsenimonas suaedae]MCM2972752.1 (Fe-S)-binding protein [Larsenimonas suaedae]MDR5894451.1 (Fe-S)-binding protein [Larsenimonas suaedae]